MNSSLRSEALSYALKVTGMGAGTEEVLDAAKEFQKFLEGGHEAATAVEPKLRTFRVTTRAGRELHELVFEIKPGWFAFARSRKTAELKVGVTQPGWFTGYRLYDIETGEEFKLA